jgi:hypothetical protein
METKIFYQFELYLYNKLVGYETHAIDPDIGTIGIYHKSPGSHLTCGYPVTMGDQHYIFHDNKILKAE